MTGRKVRSPVINVYQKKKYLSGRIRSVKKVLSEKWKEAISSVVPMCAHVDHVEHDVHVVVTEQGLADLRCLSAKERAELIIENCCHPDYRPQLRAYYEQAKKVSYGQNVPLDLENALSWHRRYQLTGSMKES